MSEHHPGGWGSRPDPGMWWNPDQQSLHHQHMMQAQQMAQHQEQIAASTAASQSQQLFSYKMASSFDSNVSSTSPVGAQGIREYDYRLGGGNPTMSMPSPAAQWWYPQTTMDNMHSSMLSQQSPQQTMAPVQTPPPMQSDAQARQEEAHRQQQQEANRQHHEAVQRHQEAQRQQNEAIHRHHQEQQRQQVEAQHAALQQHHQALVEAQQRHQQQLNNHHSPHHQSILQQQQIQQQLPPVATKGRMPRAKADARPRGRMTAYAFFVQTCREEHKKKHPEENVVFAEFSRKCADRWKTMLDKEKKRFHEMAENDKKRYDSEMQNYTPPKGEKTRGKKRKQIKDPNAPKRSLSAFFWFSNDERGKVKAQNPEYGVGDIAKELGRRWADADPETKGKFEALADKDKQRYEKEMTAYKKRNNQALQPAQPVHVPENDDDDEEDEEEDD
ncbi:hypothetical protein HHI36_009812 [Cryptolaemus montrouzieri]|uniref:HMG box domain-containing protein n=1 Tax=Cryptolaemus montrouzieri TaxID=559131 RepID=A0ABD2MGZ5_9CUCU